MAATGIKDIDKFMALARRRHDYALTCDQADREAALDDVRFRAGGEYQWTAEALRARKSRENPRPIVTWNLLPVFIQSVVNDGRQQKPAIEVIPLDGGDPKTAELIQDRIRHIEYESNADVAYDTSSDQQIGSGFGFYRVTTKYAGVKSTRQIPRIVPIEDQFSVLLDPAAKEYDKSDADWCFVDTTISREDHARLYGKNFSGRTSRANAEGYWTDKADANPAPSWFNIGKKGDDIQLSEYWVREHENKTVYHLKDGTGVFEEELPKDAEGKPDHSAVKTDADDNEVTHEGDVCTVTQYLIDGVDILDKTEWLGTTIPIVPVYGNSMIVDGERQTFSLIRNAKEAQRLINYFISGITEAIGSASRAEWWMPVGGVTNNADQIASSNVNGIKVLFYNQTGPGNTTLAPPSRAAGEPPIQAMVAGLQQAIAALKQAMGIFDPSLGRPDNAVSGLAINARTREADNVNFHFHDNQCRSRRRCGRIILEVEEALDEQEETATGRRKDGTTYTVNLNEQFTGTDGKSRNHRVKADHYNLGITTAPSWLSARQQAHAELAQIIQSAPGLLSEMGDLFFASSDAPGSQEAADRMKKVIQMKSPGLIEDPNKPQPLPPQAQQAMNQGKQLIMQLSQKVHALSDQLDSKQPEISARIQIAEMQEETKREQIQAELRIAELNAANKHNTTQLEYQIDAIQHSIDAELKRQQFTMQSSQPGAPTPASPAPASAPDSGEPSPPPAPGAGVPQEQPTGVPNA